MRQPVDIQPAVYVWADDCASSQAAASSLHEAAQAGDARVVRDLLRRADRDAVLQRDYSGWTVLHHAVQGASTDCVSLLLEAKADVDARTDTRATALHLAAFHGNLEVTLLLVLRGANVHVEDEDGHTPLYDAQFKTGGKCTCVADTPQSQPGRVVAFLQRAMALETDTERRASAERAWELHVAQALDEALTVDGAAALPRLLARHQRYIDARDHAGWCALHGAARVGDVRAVQRLLDCGASVHTTTNLGESALHLAAREGHAPVAQLLLARGARADATTRRGLTPIALARRHAAVDGATPDGADVPPNDLVAMLEAAVADREADRQRPAAEAARRWLPLASAVVMAQGARPTYASFATVPGSHPFDTDHTLTAATDGAGSRLSTCTS